MIYVRLRGASNKRTKGSVTPAENRQIFIKFSNIGAAVEFFTGAGFELKSHPDGVIFVGRNLSMKIKLGSNAELRFPPQEYLVADVPDCVDPETVSFKRDRRSGTTKAG